MGFFDFLKKKPQEQPVVEQTEEKELIFADKEQTGKQYAIPSAFGAYSNYIKEEKR